MSGLIRTLYWVQAFEGDYKWILYGDDDTFFFVDGVLELLQDFDPSLPYFITGEDQCSTLHTCCQHYSTTLSYTHAWVCKLSYHKMVLTCNICCMQALLSAFRITSM